MFFIANNNISCENQLINKDSTRGIIMHVTLEQLPHHLKELFELIKRDNRESRGCTIQVIKTYSVEDANIKVLMSRLIPSPPPPGAMNMITPITNRVDVKISPSNRELVAVISNHFRNQLANNRPLFCEVVINDVPIMLGAI